jgi:hypothetical protein
MTDVVTLDETRYSVSTLARDRGAAFGRVIGTSSKVASAKLRRFTKAMLSRMEVGDEQKFPIPSSRGPRRSFVVRKTGEDEFVVRIIEFKDK